MAERAEIQPAFDQVAAGVAASSLGVVTVNWNGWADTLECLEAVFRMQGFAGPVVIVDNGSDDGSIEKLIAWANGLLCVVPQNRQPQIERLVIPPVAKPIAPQVLDPSAMGDRSDWLGTGSRLFIISAGHNLGFAAANNLGIKFLLASSSIDLIWFINNDALPREDAYREIANAVPPDDEPLMSGSVLVEYADPMTIQTIGGNFAPYSGVSRHIMAGQNIDELNRLEQRVEVDYPIGAGMMVNRRFVTKYGLMCEDYFLYFEEIDWALRMTGNLKPFIVPRSIVFHKGGATTAAGRRGTTRSLPADFYMLRNRLLIARRVSFAAFISCVLLSPGSIIRRMFRSRKGLVLNAIEAVRDGLLGRSGRKLN